MSKRTPPNSRRIKILGSGVGLPKNAVTSESLDGRLGRPVGWIEKKSGVHQRYFAESTESTSSLAAEAAQEALKAAKLETNQLDCIVSACGVMEQAGAAYAQCLY